ncbi:MAG TPA: acetyl-CoA hydrolase/transferase C-terminal domain-containing protein [Syntrophomonadaceae bacterium]|nr:acetyl-CoA hydrolase/transferase C-terminal domain-containing protein [Syntrophomonadaceae bacterium]
MDDVIKWQYEQKVVSAEEAVKVVKSGDIVSYGEFALFPAALDAALAKRVNELENVRAMGVSFSRVPEIVKADPERKHFILQDMHFSVFSRHLADHNLCNYIPNTYQQGPRIIRKYKDVDVAFITVSAMDGRGFFNIGLANSVTPSALQKSKIVVVEVNENIPICLGGNQESINLNQIDYIVEGPNDPLLKLPDIEATPEDRKIAEIVLKEIEDGACLQLGIGGLPNAIGELIADSDLKDLGVHSEMMMDAFVDLYENGSITGAQKAIDKFKMVYSFALGSKRLYEFLDHNPVCASYPVDYTNDPRIIALNDKTIAVNNALNVDLLSQVSSETIGTRQISGTGGQLDFVTGAFASSQGKGIICLHSTYTDAKGEVHSRINSTLPLGTVVTVPRSMVQYIATEYGIVQLKGESTWGRAEAIIGIAHPDFRDDLIKEAEKMKIWSKSNQIEM